MRGSPVGCGSCGSAGRRFKFESIWHRDERGKQQVNSTIRARCSEHAYESTHFGARISQHTCHGTHTTARTSEYARHSTRIGARITEHAYQSSHVTARMSEHAHHSTHIPASISRHAYRSRHIAVRISVPPCQRTRITACMHACHGTHIGARTPGQAYQSTPCFPRAAVPVRWAVQRVRGIRPGAGSLRPSEGVPGEGAVFLVLRARALSRDGCRRLRKHPRRQQRTPAEKTKLSTASHCGAVHSLRSITVRPVAFRRLASHHTAPWRAWHRLSCFSAVRRVSVRPVQPPRGTTFPR